MPARGGEPRRLTFLGRDAGFDRWAGAPTAREIYFVANPDDVVRKSKRVRSRSPRRRSPRDLSLGHARSLSFGPRTAGSCIGRNAADPARWKRYRGGTAGEIWIDADGSGSSRGCRLPDGNPMLADVDRRTHLFPRRPRRHRQHLFVRARRHRRHAPHARRRVLRALSVDRRRAHRLLGRRRDRVSTTSRATDDTASMIVDAARPRRKRCAASRQASESLEHFAPQPDGTRVAFVVARASRSRCRSSKARRYVIGIGSRARTRLPSGSTTASASSPSPTSTATSRSPSIAPTLGAPSNSSPPATSVASPTSSLSPTATSIAFANHRHELCVVDLDDGEVRVLDTSPAHRIADFAFSPDGRFIAYVWWPAHGTSIVRVVKVRSGKMHDVTSPLRTDQSPAWDPDGKVSLLHLDARFQSGLRRAAVRPELSAGEPPVRRDAAQRRARRRSSRSRSRCIAITRARSRRREESRQAGRSSRSISTASPGACSAFRSTRASTARSSPSRERVLFTRFPVKGIKPSRRDDDRATTKHGTLLAYDFEQQRLRDDRDRMRRDSRSGRDGRTLLYRVARPAARDRRTRPNCPKTATNRSRAAEAGPQERLDRPGSRAASRSCRATSGRRCTAKRGACRPSSSGSRT